MSHVDLSALVDAHNLNHLERIHQLKKIAVIERGIDQTIIHHLLNRIHFLAVLLLHGYV
jgi:hypothetical protein